MNSKKREARDWRDGYFNNTKLNQVLALLEKLGADTEYVLWLAELVRRSDNSRHQARPIKNVTVHFPPWPALSGAAFLAGAKDRHEYELRKSELLTRFASGWWYGADKRWHQSSYRESCERHEIQMRRLITNTYMATAIKLAKSGKVKPLPDNPYEGGGNSPGDLARGTSNMLYTLQHAVDNTKTRRRQIYNHGRSSDSWGTFFLLALSEHLKERSAKKQPYYVLCNQTLSAVRGCGGKSAKVRVHQFKKAHVEWPQLLDQAARDFNPPEDPSEEPKPPDQPQMDPLDRAIATLKALQETGILKVTAAEVNQAIEDNTLLELFQSRLKQITTDN